MDNMDNKPSENELKYNLVLHFRGKETTQDELTEYCKEVGLTPLVMSQLEEYTFQVELDEKSAHIFNEVKELIQKTQYQMTFDTDAHAKEVIEANENTAIEIAKMIEEKGVQYRFVTTIMDEMGTILGETVKSAGTRIFNKMSSALRHMAYVKFGEEFNTKNSRDYMVEAYTNAEEKNKSI